MMKTLVFVVTLGSLVILTFGKVDPDAEECKMDPEEKEKNLEELKEKGWKLVSSKDGKKEKIRKTFEFKDFKEAFAFMTQVAGQAERIQHHPDWFNGYNKVDVTLQRWDCGEIITHFDITLANFMEQAAG